MNKFWGPVACLALVLLCGCSPLFKNPLGNVDTAKPDVSLYGFWMTSNAKDQGNYFLLRIASQKDGRLEVVMSGYSPEKTEIYTFRGFPVRIGDKGYLNLRPVTVDLVGVLQQKQVEVDAWLFARYEVARSGRELKVWFINQSTIANAIKSHRLQGTISKSNEVSVDESTENLVKFMQNEEDCFEKRPLVFEKVKLVAEPVETRGVSLPPRE